MELDFSFTLVRSVPVKKTSRKNKNKDTGSGDTAIVATQSETKKVSESSTLSLTRRRRYQNFMNENKVLNETESKNIDTAKEREIIKEENNNIKSPDELVDNSVDRNSIGNRLTKQLFEEDKENLSPVKKDSLVMSTNAVASKSNRDDIVGNTSTAKPRLSNSSIGNKNSSSSSVEGVDLKKVSIRRHQFESYRKYIRNDKLYFYKRKKNVIKEDSVSVEHHNEIHSRMSCDSVKGCNDVHSRFSRDMFVSSLLSYNDRPETNILESNKDSVTKGTSLKERSSTVESISEKLNDSQFNSSRNSNNAINNLIDSKSSSKGIKRSITVARNSFKKSEKTSCVKSFNSSIETTDNSESLYFRGCTKKKGDGLISSDDDQVDVTNRSYYSVVNGTIDSVNKTPLNCVNKSVSLHDISRLSGVNSLHSDNNDDSIASNNKRPSDELFSKRSIKAEKNSVQEIKIDSTVHEDVSHDIFNNSVKRKFSKADKKKDFNTDKSGKINNEEVNFRFNKSKSTTDTKTLKNVSLNSTLDFEKSIVESSTPHSKMQGPRRNSKSLKSCVENNIGDINKNKVDKVQNIPLSLPLPSYESPLLSKSKFKDIKKWLSDTEKCKNKNLFDSSDSNNEDEISVSPPLINKKLKSSHFSSIVRSDSKIKPTDVRTPEPADFKSDIRKPLTEPNKVYPVTRSKPRSIQKKRSVKKEKKTINLSSDSEEIDNPAARILDQLYGESWRSANVLPVTEPRNLRKKAIPIPQLPVTERKNIHRSNLFSSSSSSEDHFDEFLQKTRLKRLELTKRRIQLNKIHESSFIKDSLSEGDDRSLLIYQKTISSDIKKEVDALSDSKWSGNSGHSHISSKKPPRRLSFSSIKGSENTDSSNLKSIISSKKRKKIKKKSPDKIIKKHLPINTSHHHSSDGSGKKKKKNIIKKKHHKELKSDGIDNNDDKKILPNEPVVEVADPSDLNKEKKVVVLETPKLMKDTPVKTITPNSVDKLLTPGCKTDAVFPNTPRHTLSFLSSLSVVTANLRCHPSALMYKKNYKTKKEELSRKLFMLYNKEVFENKLPNDTLLQWNGRMRSTSGFCYNRRIIKNSGDVLRTSRIVLSSKILDTPDRLRDTLIHEMCHAATWIIDGISDGHGPCWKNWASKAMLRFPELPRIKRCHDYDIKTKYTYRCIGCGYSFGRHSKSLDTERKRCGYCYGKFELLVNLKEKTQGNRRGGATPASSVYSDANTRTPRPVTGFALFVKENYGEIKKSNNALPHKDVMKLLGQKFSEFKLSQKQKEMSASK